METKHTPGPWKAEEVHIDGTPAGETVWQILGRIGGVSAALLARLAGGCAPPAERAANARLIAAAPDLLAACLGVIPLIEDERVQEFYGDEFTALELAVKKARGTL